MRIVRQFLFSLAIIFAPAAATAETASMADSIVDAIGVNTHLDVAGPYQTHFSDWVVQAFVKSGIRHFRDGVKSNETTAITNMKALFAATGGPTSMLATTIPASCSFTLGLNGTQEVRPSTYLNAGIAPSNIMAFEGYSEVNGKCPNYSVTNYKAWQAAMRSEVSNTTSIASLPVLGPPLNASIPSLGDPTSFNNLGDISSNTYETTGSVHDYCGIADPACHYSWLWSSAQINSNANPVWITETGYNNTATEAQQNTYLSTAFFDYWNGIGTAQNQHSEHAFIYQLLDTDGTTSDGTYGLIRTDGSWKPALTTIANTIAVMKDPGAAFTPGSLNFTLTGGDSATQHALFQKRDGTYYLVLWQRHNTYDSFAACDLTITYAAGSNVSVYDPTVSSTAQLTQTNVTSTTVTVSNHAVILAISPGVSSAFTVSAPANNSTVSGNVTISGAATGQWVDVSCYVNSVKICADVTPSGGTYSLSFPTAGLPNGSTSVSVTASSVPAGQTGGTTTTITLTLTISNGGVDSFGWNACNTASGTNPSTFTPLSDAAAAAKVVLMTENRAASNVSGPLGDANHYIPSAAELTTFLAETDANGHTPVQINPYYQYVTGNYAGTTDDIIQWGAAKWGIPADWLRAQYVNNSNWDQLPASGACGATCSDPACGESTAVGNSSNYPAFTRQDATHVCQGVGISTTRWDHPDINKAGIGTEPLRWKSTAFNIDYQAATIRYYFDDPQGTRSSLGDTSYGKCQNWLSIAAWLYPFPWNNTSQQGYVTTLQKIYSTTRDWLLPSFPPAVPITAPTGNSTPGPVCISAGNAAGAGPCIADAGYNNGKTASNWNGAVDTSLVPNPLPQAVYQFERFGPSFFYLISSLNPNTNYEVMLQFTEDFDTAIGQRVFNVSIQNVPALTNFDIYATAGAQHKAVAKTFFTNADANGFITINFTGTNSIDTSAKVDAVQVLQQSGACR